MAEDLIIASPQGIAHAMKEMKEVPPGDNLFVESICLSTSDRTLPIAKLDIVELQTEILEVRTRP